MRVEIPRRAYFGRRREMSENWKQSNVQRKHILTLEVAKAVSYTHLTLPTNSRV